LVCFGNIESKASETSWPIWAGFTGIVNSDYTAEHNDNESDADKYGSQLLGLDSVESHMGTTFDMKSKPKIQSSR
jgi:hypothetical protein